MMMIIIIILESYIKILTKKKHTRDISIDIYQRRGYRDNYELRSLKYKVERVFDISTKRIYILWTF